MRIAIWENAKKGAFYLSLQEYEYLFNKAEMRTDRAWVTLEKTHLVIRRASAAEAKLSGSRKILTMASETKPAKYLTFYPADMPAVHNWRRMRGRFLPSREEQIKGIPVLVVQYSDITDCIAVHGETPTEREVEPLYKPEQHPAGPVMKFLAPTGPNGHAQLKAAKDLFMEEFRKHPDAKLALTPTGELTIQIVTTVNI